MDCRYMGVGFDGSEFRYPCEITGGEREGLPCGIADWDDYQDDLRDEIDGYIPF